MPVLNGISTLRSEQSGFQIVRSGYMVVDESRCALHHTQPHALQDYQMAAQVVVGQAKRRKFCENILRLPDHDSRHQLLEDGLLRLSLPRRVRVLFAPDGIQLAQRRAVRFDRFELFAH